MKSMTGYGKGEAAGANRKVTIEIKSVNNRFLDINTRFPKSLSYVEDVVKKKIQEVVKRGTLDVYYTYEVTGETDKVVETDVPLAAEYLTAMRKIRDEFGLPDDITTMSLVRMQDVLVVTAAEENRDEIKELFESPAAEAVRSLDAMRTTEGKSVQAVTACAEEGFDPPLFLFFSARKNKKWLKLHRISCKMRRKGAEESTIMGAIRIDKIPGGPKGIFDGFAPALGASAQQGGVRSK